MNTTSLALQDINPKTQTQPQRHVVYPTHTVPYHRQTLAESVYAVCLKAFGYAGEAEMTAACVCKDVEAWLEDKFEVTSNDIRRKTAESLKRYNPRAAYLYHPCKAYVVTEDAYGIAQV